MAALAQLSEEQRAALVLVDMEGYSVDEAAAILECAPGTVKSRCSRGRARLVPLLTSYRRNQPDHDDVEPLSTQRTSAPAPEPAHPRHATTEEDVHHD
jgi:RNA polymerase sigma-70 factor (ECF subfamily)